MIDFMDESKLYDPNSSTWELFLAPIAEPTSDSCAVSNILYPIAPFEDTFYFQYDTQTKVFDDCILPFDTPTSSSLDLLIPTSDFNYDQVLVDPLNLKIKETSKEEEMNPDIVKTEPVKSKSREVQNNSKKLKLAKQCTQCDTKHASCWYRDKSKQGHICRKCYTKQNLTKQEILPDGTIAMRACNRCGTFETTSWYHCPEKLGKFDCIRCYHKRRMRQKSSSSDEG
jgi:hypothetical protein